MSHNRNPKGKNQHEHVSADEDFERRLEAALRKYHGELKTNNSEIATLLQADHKIALSASTVKRRRKSLGLSAGAGTMKNLPKAEAEQLIVNKMDKDPAKCSGVRTIWAKVVFEDGIILPRDFVWEIMHVHDSEAFEAREPTAKKIFRVPIYPIGIHQRWSGDGHDKLYKIGFPIWAIVDHATAKILRGWVVPSNRMGDIIGYLFLCLVEEYGGIPLQTTTDCGSETTVLYGIVNTLRKTFHPDIDSEELPPHMYLRSVHNISIERQWLRLRLDFGDSSVLNFNQGIADGKYRSSDANQYELCQWLWPRVLQADLDTYADFRNGVKMRKQSNKPGPSVMSCNTAFSLPEKWGGRDCLLKVDLDVVRQMKQDMGGDGLIAFSTPEFAERAQTVYDSLLITKLTQANVWDVFTIMLPLVFPDRP
ncbi:hypothetical protein B0H10DRAFT_2159630 [Mycena sp. CBHHK59/15]|nr:hypothetical protein B0H10DRAFT_2159630 [Mycena sp. CBHHK59/15]